MPTKEPAQKSAANNKAAAGKGAAQTTKTGAGSKPASSSTRCKRQKDVGKIMQTTDGYFANNSTNTKKRLIAVVAQRKDDGAVAVVKLHEKKPRKKNRIPNLVLSPEKHPSLDVDTEVEKRIYIGTKSKQPIFPRAIQDTGDKLTRKEKRIINKGAGGNTRKNRKAKRRKLKKWKNHFPEEKNRAGG